MTKPKLTIASAFYGTQEPSFWLPLANVTGTLHKIGVEFMGAMGSGSMMADSNRNNIVKAFLETLSEWLLWIDTDNMIMTGAIKRLLDANRTLVSGLYYAKAEPYHPIAYYRQPTGMYRNITESDFERGDIIPIDAAGCGFLLTHRSVYEDIRDTFLLFQDDSGLFRAFHPDDVKGVITDGKRHHTDGKVVGGQLRTRIIPVHTEPGAWPWFQLGYGRTEDLTFFEKALQVGHKPWLDTSVEAGHDRRVVVTGEIRRKFVETRELQEPRQPENLPVVVYIPQLEGVDYESA